MKTFFLTAMIAVSLFICSKEIRAQTIQTKLTESPIESKLAWATWRTDIYICTGIAYAKSLGMTAKDFAAFVGSKHNITSPTDTSISAVVKILFYLFKNYPNGKFELLSESNSSATMRWNRPYSSYFADGTVFGVSIEEFESVLYGHAAIMTKRIGIDFKYDIKQDTVFGKLTRYR
jgi:hypothetical protein